MKSGGAVFLTGGSGFIGSRLVRVLRSRGDRVRCLVRDPNRAGGLARLGAELVAGDITDTSALARGLAGAESAIHLAAVYDVGVVDKAAMERTNVEGTSAFLDAISRARTPRSIHVSTTVALLYLAFAMKFGNGWTGVLTLGYLIAPNILGFMGTTEERLAQWAQHRSGAVERAPGPSPQSLLN